MFSPPPEDESSISKRDVTTFTTFTGSGENEVDKDEAEISHPSGETGETSRTYAENIPHTGETSGEPFDESDSGPWEQVGGEYSSIRSVLESPPEWMRNTYLKGFREGKWDARLVANAVATALQMSPHEDGPRIRPLVEAALEELGIRPK